MIYRIFAAALLLVLISLHAQAQQGNSIRGKVRNSLGVNMSQVIVNIETGNGSPFGQTATNAEGDFFFGGLTDTSYVLIISTADYNPVSEHVDFVNRTGPDSPGETRTIDITLTPKGGALGAARPGTSFVQNVPPTARAAFERAVALSKQGKSQEAITASEEAVRIFPDYFDAHIALANELMKMGRLNEAIAQLEQARRINPKDNRVYQSFGLVLMQQRKYAVAAAVFGEAFRLNPLDPQNPLMRGVALIEHASSINPTQSKDAPADRNKAFSDAESSLLQAYELSGKKLTTVYLQLARLYEKRGEPGRAATELELYLHETPGAKNADEIRKAINTLRSTPHQGETRAP